jgi:hypothetical protein
MPTIFRRRIPAAIALLLPFPLAFALVFLAEAAPRDWSLHWKPSGVVIPAASYSDFASTATPRGFDVLWTDNNNRPIFSRLDTAGHPLAPNLNLGGTALMPALAHIDGTVYAAWREDAGNLSLMRLAVLRPGSPIREYVVARGPWPLERPFLFRDGPEIGMVFSWQEHGPYNVYLTKIGQHGPSKPVRLTYESGYAFLPHAMLDAAGTLHLVYFSLCCAGDQYNLIARRFTSSGRPLGRARTIDKIRSMTGNNQSTPENWGVSLLPRAKSLLLTWVSDAGIQSADLNERDHYIWGPRVVVPDVSSQTLAVTASGNHFQLVWEQPFDLGTYLATVGMSAGGRELGQPDRVAFLPASTTSPEALIVQHTPVLLFQASPSGSQSAAIELSRFTPHVLGPATVWLRLGLGLANPFGNLLIVLVAALGLGIAITIANFLILMALIVAYLVIAWVAPRALRWPSYAVVLAVILYLLFVAPGAQSPPLLVMGVLPLGLGPITVAGAAVFVIFLLRTVLWRIDDIYRAAVMAFMSVYFIAFLEALTIVQTTVARI